MSEPEAGLNRTIAEGARAEPPLDATRHRPDASPSPEPELIGLRFGPFELDVRTSELRRAGLQVKLQRQPARVLELLARQAGELVTRDEIRRQVWGAETFVDFDQGLNFCIRQVRTALGDDAGLPRFVETLPRRGYRFLAATERVYAGPTPEATPPAESPVTPEPPRSRDDVPPRPRRFVLKLAAAAGVLALLGAGLATWPRKASAPTPVEARKLALVVLPLDNLSGDPDHEYWSDGLTEELITQLARLHPERLAVIARTSSMSYKGRRVDVARVARELAVDYVLEGSLRRSGGRVRITAQLIRASDQTHVWASSYDAAQDDVLGVQQDVSRRIVATLAEHLLPVLPTAPNAPTSADAAAYDAYLRGRHLWGRGTPESLSRSRELLEQAVARDPGFGAAHVALARVWLTLADRDLRPPSEASSQARLAAARALSVDPTLADAHVVLGIVQGYYEWRLPEAQVAFERALKLAPGSAEAHHAMGDWYSARGQHDLAVATVQRAIALDPVSVAVRQDLGWYLFFARRHGEALTAFRHALEFNPDDQDAQLGSALAAWYAGQHEQAVSQQIDALRQRELIDEARASELRRLDPRGAQRELLLLARARGASPWGYLLPAMLGDRAATLRALEAAAERHSRYLLVFVASDPRLDFVRAEPRFQALRRRLGLAQAPGPGVGPVFLES